MTRRRRDHLIGNKNYAELCEHNPSQTNQGHGISHPNTQTRFSFSLPVITLAESRDCGLCHKIKINYTWYLRSLQSIPSPLSFQLYLHSTDFYSYGSIFCKSFLSIQLSPQLTQQGQINAFTVFSDYPVFLQNNFLWRFPHQFQLF